MFATMSRPELLAHLDRVQGTIPECEFVDPTAEGCEAFSRRAAADAQRAKLAMLGLSARITEREQAGRTVYRVRLGPFDAREQAEDAQAKLAAGGIEANLVRVER